MTAPGSATDLRARLREKALALGFDAMGFAAASAVPEAKAGLADFLARGHQGDMGWLAANAERRGDPAALWPAARTVVVVAANYGPADDPLAILARPDRGAISCYAQGGRDYHEVLMGRLRQLARWTSDHLGGEVKVFADTAPVMEKPLARQAGLGWQGKHTNLVSRDFGSWLFLGEMFTTLEFPPDAATADHCGSCGACLDVCPTRAFPAPYQLDATRCISYLTIEHKGVIAREFRAAMGNRIFGCDDCLAVCPWNKFARRTETPDFLPQAALTAPRLAELAALDDVGFRQAFAKTAIKRTGRDRFLRNVLIAIGNSADPALASVALARLGDPSALVRGMAVWALSRLLAPARFQALRQHHLGHEADPAVRQEWTLEGADG
jgi:epoxyqueuosine reductase